MITISQLFVYPVKSCRGIALEKSRLFAEGLEHDRRWMIVDAQGQFLSQRQLPAMARIAVALVDPDPGPDPSGIRAGARAGAEEGTGPDRADVIPDLILRLAGEDGDLGPAAPEFRVRPDHDAGPHPARVWSFQGVATDCGGAVAAFLSDFLGCPVRLLRFDDRQPRNCNAKWTRGHDARTRFADGFPLLILGEASVADLAARMGVDFLALERFRPNLVLSGLPAYEEDFIRSLEWPQAADPAVSLQLTKPCARCSIPGLDPLSGRPRSGDPTALLATFRYHPAVEGAVLGMNALPLNACGATLNQGLSLNPVFDF